MRHHTSPRRKARTRSEEFVDCCEHGITLREVCQLCEHQLELDLPNLLGLDEQWRAA